MDFEKTQNRILVEAYKNVLINSNPTEKVEFKDKNELNFLKTIQTNKDIIKEFMLLNEQEVEDIAATPPTTGQTDTTQTSAAPSEPQSTEMQPTSGQTDELEDLLAAGEKDQQQLDPNAENSDMAEKFWKFCQGIGVKKPRFWVLAAWLETNFPDKLDKVNDIWNAPIKEDQEKGEEPTTETPPTTGDITSEVPATSGEQTAQPATATGEQAVVENKKVMKESKGDVGVIQDDKDKKFYAVRYTDDANNTKFIKISAGFANKVDAEKVAAVEEQKAGIKRTVVKA